jgi:serine/threonine protein kinase
MYSKSGVCKLIDFGMSLRLPRVRNDESVGDDGANDDRSRPVLQIPPQGTCGKPNYIAPEVMENTQYFHPQKSDIWSLGVILFIMLTGVPPVAVAYDLDDRYRLICEGGLEAMLRQWGFHLSSEAVDLLYHILRPKPMERLTLNQIAEHPWVLGETIILMVTDDHNLNDVQVRHHAVEGII